MTYYQGVSLWWYKECCAILECKLPSSLGKKQLGQLLLEALPILLPTVTQRDASPFHLH